MARILLGTATTDSNGVAVLSDGYTGTGAGKVDIIAETTVDGSTVQSEPYTLWDTYQYDNGNDSTHSIWDTPYQCTLTYGSEYAEISESTEYGFIRSATAFPKNCIIEFDYYNLDGVDASNIFQIQTSANGYVTVISMQYLGLSSGNWYHLKITIEDGVLKVYKDNATTPVYTYPSSGSMTIATDTIKFLMMTTGATTKVRFKNFKIYSY